MNVFVNLTIVSILIIATVFGQKPIKKKPSGAQSPVPQQGPAPAQPQQGPKSAQPQQGPKSAQPQQGPPELNWGKCPQLAPTKAEETKKNEVTQKCLKQHPIPANLNDKIVKAHSKQVTECALKEDKWFDKRGRYRYSRTTNRLTTKKLPKNIETQLIESVTKCRTEAEQKFPKKQEFIDSVQLFQACMNFHTTKVCDIKLKNKKDN